jgi:uncharacterized membrane protein
MNTIRHWLIKSFWICIPFVFVMSFVLVLCLGFTGSGLLCLIACWLLLPAFIQVYCDDNFRLWLRALK